MALRNVRVLAAAVALAAVGLAGCKRETPAEDSARTEHLKKFQAIDVEQNGVDMHLSLPGWAYVGYDDDADVHIFAYEKRRLLIQLRRYKRTDPKRLPEEAADDALQAFCPKKPCKVGVIKPGYWLSHYDSEQDGMTVLNWDLASFPTPDVMALAVIKVFGADNETHKAIERALKESLQLSLTGNATFLKK